MEIKKIYITGVPGTGKSTIAKELEKRGFLAFSIDEVEDLCNWVDKKTQKIDNNYIPSIDWLNTHDWICNIEKLKQIINTDKDLVIVTGISTNQDEYMTLFDKLFLLQCSDQTLMSRLKNRHTLSGENRFGKYEIEREYAIAMHNDFDKKLIERGVIIIDAEKPIEDIISDIISKTYAD